MGKLTLYGLDVSPPVRACQLTLKALDLSYEYVIIDFTNKGQFAKEYLEKNPQHTVPTLDDNGNFLWESHAIMAYLVSKYGKPEHEHLYPKDLLKRAVVDQRMYFESGVVFQGALRNITAPLIAKNETNVPQAKIDAIFEAYNFIEKFLEKYSYIAGDHLTIADFSLVTTVTTLKTFVDIDGAKYPKITAWIKHLEQLPYFNEINEKGIQMAQQMKKAKNLIICS